MNPPHLNETFLYRYRFGIGYALLIALTAGLLLLNLGSLPDGFTAGEQSSAIQSNSITFNKDFLQQVQSVDLPYHLLQYVSLHLFGLSPLGVRLPSIVLAAASALCIFLMLRRWLFDNVALVTGILLATSSWFLTLGRTGTPDISIVFWTSLILLLATYISQQTKNHFALRALLLLCAGLALYTPLMLYLFLSAVIAAIAQPHLRYIVRYVDTTGISLGILALGIMLVPMGFHIWRDPEIIYTYLAIPADLPSPLAFVKDFGGVLSDLANPFATQLAPYALPLLSIPLATFVLLGFARLVIDYHSARSYTLLVWFAVLVPLIGLNPNRFSLLLVPLIVVAGIGIHALFSYWYRLFPRNPYARVFGLVPISLLLITTLSFNYQRYFVASPYAENANQVYSSDPVLLNQTISTKTYQDKPVVVVVPANQTELYDINKNTNAELTVTDSLTAQPQSTVIVAESQLAQLSPDQRALLPGGAVELLTNDHAADALRFRVYSLTQQ